MKPTIAIFGLPSSTDGEIKIWLHSGGSGNFKGEEVFNSSNDESGEIFGLPTKEIEVGSQVTITIMSSGIVCFERSFTFLGGDISCVPNFRKETNTDEKHVSRDWDIDAWRAWNPNASHAAGVEAETQAVVSRRIAKVPIQEAYYYDSQIDYSEKFHKLWIGLNAFCTGWSSETGDRLKVLSLVNSPLTPLFETIVSSSKDKESAKRYSSLEKATSLNMSSNIVRDEIGRSNPVFEFLSNAKSQLPIFSENSKEIEGITFLNTRESDNLFFDIFSRYHAHMASEEGIMTAFDLNDAFQAPYAPTSIKRYGQLLFHDPFEDNSNGTLFELKDFFGPVYAGSPYLGQTTRSGQPSPEKQLYERTNPLFFRYLNLLYEFRCAYFHGDLPVTEQNNELARSAYTSLRTIYPAILR